MSIVRKFGRSIGLPVREIEKIIDTYYKNDNDNPILDFGSGTLFWSEKLHNKYNKDIYAVDLLYSKKQPKIKYNGIRTFSNLSDIQNNMSFSMIFTCDVLHHVDKTDLNSVLEKFTLSSDLIIIKDIEATDIIGNLQNKIHDFLINRQLVNDIYSKKLENFLQNKNYQTQIIQMKKFGYPHFLLVAYR